MMRLWGARVLAVMALVGTVAAVALTITGVEGSSELTVEGAQEATARLNDVNRPVGERLEALEPGSSPAEAQAAVRTAAGETRSQLEDGTGEGSLADRLEAVLRAELAYLDALGSTLNNPRSSLKGTIGQRAQELREQLQNIPGGDDGLIRGGQELIAYSDARIE